MSNQWGQGGWGPPQQGYPQQPYQQGYQQPYNPQQNQFVQPPAGVPDPDKNRRIAGCGCLGIGCLLGSIVFVWELVIQTKMSSEASLLSIALAFIPVMIYLAVPYMVDRFDPEPWWALAGVFAWGALFATGVSGIVNTVVSMSIGGPAGDFVGATFSAPIIEELTKGMAILGIVIFLRREFDGVVDGIIYGTFAGIGFAAVENIGYYFRYREAMGMIFVVRGVLSPWLHPLFTSMTGIGFGLGREHGATWAKILFPAFGYAGAVFLHMVWNGSGFIMQGEGALFVKLGVGILLALVFFVIIVALVVRKGRTIREYLRDEVLVGTMTQEEVDLVCSAFGRLNATMRHGAAGRDFVKTAARLALSKWHSARAMKGQKMTISFGFIAPLRQELARLRGVMAARMQR